MSLNSTFLAGAVAVATSLFASTSATAAIIVTNSHATFNMLVTNFGGGIDVENFAGYSDVYASGLTGGTGAGSWTATAPGHLFAQSGIMSTAVANEALTFTFSDSSVFAIGGNFFLTDYNFGSLPGLIVVTSNNVAYVYATNGPVNSFAGFVSTGGSIQSISISTLPSAVNAWASTNELVVGFVPAPAVIGLFAVAGLIRGRRRD